MHSDVVIIGGGLGGLSAGAYLAQNNVQVILVEEQSQVGGYAINFKRDEFVFDVALHAIPGCAPGQAFHKLLTQLKIVDELTFIKLNDAFNVNLAEYNFVIPNSFSDFFHKLETEFPDDQTGLRQLKSYLFKYGPLYFDVVEGRSGFVEICTKFIPRIPDFLKNSYSSTDVFLGKYVKGKRLKALLYQAAVFFGEPMSEFPAINFIIMFYLMFKSGMYTIQGGGQALTSALENKMLEHGSQIITGHRVESIHINHKIANAVLLNDGRRITCKAVLSNVNTPELVNTLIAPGYLPTSYMDLVNNLKPSLSILQMHLGLDCTVEEIGIQYYLNIFFPNENIDSTIYWQNQSTMMKGFSIIAPGINYPEAQSNIRRIVSIVGGVSGQNWIGLDVIKYKNLKKQVSVQIIDLIEAHFPGLRQHINTIDLATPHTFHRYTQNPAGAILGFKAERGKHRKLIKINRFPIKNIYLTGGWTNRLGGFMQSIKSGLAAAQKSIKYLDKYHQ